MSMTGKEKLYFLLNRIVDVREITPAGQPLKIHATHHLNNKYRGDELDLLFTKLEKDEKVLRILKTGNRIKEVGYRYGLNDYDDGCCHVELLPTFDKYFLKIQREPEYQKFTGKTPPPEASSQKSEDLSPKLPFPLRPVSEELKDAEEVYYNEVIPDNTNELIKKAEQARVREHKEILAERRHRQDLKQKRILAAKEDKFTHAISLIIERAEYRKGTSFSIDFYDFNFEDTMDNLRVLLSFLDSLKASGCLKSYSKTNYTGGTRLGFIGVSLKKLKSYATAYKQKNKVSTGDPSEFLLTVKDREIRINNYLIAKPHAIGDNLEFFEHIRKQPADKQIKRKDLDAYLQEQLGDKRFFKILNALGFKSEIKKAFFYKVDANTLCYRGDKLTSQQLKKAGVNTKLFIKELEVADAKYNPN